MKKWLISFFVLVLIFSTILLFVFLPKKNNNKKNKKTNEPKVETKVNKSNKKKNEQESKTVEVKDDINKDDNSNNANDENKDENLTTNQQQEEPVSVAPVVEQPQTQVVQPEPVQVSQPEQQPVVLEPQTAPEPKPWDNLGITEYEYYHSPMWSWARVDYAIETYGSFAATHQACIDAGERLEDITSYACTNINSYSGDYLGDMLRVKY
ncbi:MAG: hypothetical protein IKN87_04645 [Bacilli bacterium]|nr:hypothetical protein [Bacilli bacterium]